MQFGAAAAPPNRAGDESNDGMAPASVPKEADHSNITGFRPGMEKPVTTASVPIQKLPKMRLTEAVEFVEPKLDVTMTAALDTALLAVTAWCSQSLCVTVL